MLCKEPFKAKGKTKKQTIEQHLAAATLWNIWNERNRRTFKEEERTTVSVWEDTQAITGLWTSRSSLFKNYTSSSIALNLHAFVSG